MLRQITRSLVKRSYCQVAAAAAKNDPLIPEDLRGIADNLRARGESLEILNKLQAAEDPLEIQRLSRFLPNDLHPSVDPSKTTPTLISEFGTPEEFPFRPASFENLGTALDGFLWENLTLITGQKSYAFKNQLANLEWALIKRSLDFLREKGFQLVTVPDVIHPRIVESCGFPVEGERTQVYFIDSPSGTCLSGTGEMGIAALLENQVIPAEDLPLKLATVSRCFRAEVSGLKEEKGLYRVHQFTKVEMFCVGRNSDVLVEEILQLQQELFSPLDLHYKVLDMPACDLGPSAARKFDIEAWMPAKKLFGEISSTSSCTDYQSKRLNITSSDGERIETANGTACAVPRMMIALLETHQQADGAVVLPEVLRPYMGGESVLEKPGMKFKHVWIRSLSGGEEEGKSKKKSKKVKEPVEEQKAAAG